MEAGKGFQIILKRLGRRVWLDLRPWDLDAGVGV